jgi:archaellum component FlaC
MSDADTEQLVTTSSDGVSVEKTFEPDDFPVPAIAFSIRSERDELVSVRLVDGVPDDVSPEDIGFHPKYGAEFWDVEEGMIVFERDFDPHEEYTTVYGLRGGDAQAAEKFMTEPALESVDPPLEPEQAPENEAGDAAGVVEDVIDEESNDSADNGSAGVDEDILESDSSSDLSDSLGEPDADGDDAEPTEQDEASEEPTDTAAAETHEESESGSASTPAEEAASVSSDESLVSRLTSEIQSGEVDDDELEELRDALDVGAADESPDASFVAASGEAEERNSVEARIEHLQSSVADLEAYTGALEEFIDENGTGDQLSELKDGFEETQERLDAFESRMEDNLEETREQLDAFESQIDDMSASVTDVEEEVDERLEAELDDVWSSIETAADDAEAASEEIDDLREELDDISEEVSEVAEMRERLASALGGTGDGN